MAECEARRVADASGMTYVSPYNDYEVSFSHLVRQHVLYLGVWPVWCNS